MCFVVLLCSPDLFWHCWLSSCAACPYLMHSRGTVILCGAGLCAFYAVSTLFKVTTTRCALTQIFLVARERSTCYCLGPGTVPLFVSDPMAKQGLLERDEFTSFTSNQSVYFLQEPGRLYVSKYCMDACFSSCYKLESLPFLFPFLYTA